MKALSIRQPWASMIVRGYKPVENRTWKASHRGPLFIHAAKKWDQAGADWIIQNISHLDKNDMDLAQELRGGIIGSVIMTDCLISHPSRWFHGDYGFVMEMPIPMTLYPCKGKLSFFEVPAGFYRHTSGVITWYPVKDCPVMRCPRCGTENEWPWDDGDHDTAVCYGGCGKMFDLDREPKPAREG